MPNGVRDRRSGSLQAMAIRRAGDRTMHQYRGAADS
jgi:hypothetical protein